MTTSPHVLTADQIKPGDPLPPLAVEVTATTVVLGRWPAAIGDPCTTTRTSRFSATA